MWRVGARQGRERGVARQLVMSAGTRAADAATAASVESRRGRRGASLLGRPGAAARRHRRRGRDRRQILQFRDAQLGILHQRRGCRARDRAAIIERRLDDARRHLLAILGQRNQPRIRRIGKKAAFDQHAGNRQVANDDEARALDPAIRQMRADDQRGMRGGGERHVFGIAALPRHSWASVTRGPSAIMEGTPRGASV